MTSKTAIQVSSLTTLPQIDALQDEWRQLEERCPDVTPFSTWEWCGAVARHHVSARPLSVYALRDNGDLVGIAPFAATRFVGLRLLRMLSSALGRYSMADYQDLLLAEGREEEAVGALFDELMGRSGWDVLHFQELAASSRATPRLMAAAAKRGWPTVLQSGSDVHMLHIDGNWDSYKGSLSRSVRNDTGRQTRKLFSEFGASFADAGSDEASTRKGMQQLFDLHTERWNAVGKPGIFRDQRRRDFHMEVALRFARRGMLALPLLQVGDEAIAIKYGFQRDGTVYYYTNGSSPAPEWKHFRLGMILDLQIIQQAFERGLRCIDLMRGESHYKDHYRMDTHLNQDLLIFRSKRAQLQYRGALAARGAAAELRRRIIDARAKLRKAA